MTIPETTPKKPYTITKQQKFSILALGVPMLLLGLYIFGFAFFDSMDIFAPPETMTLATAADIATKDNTYVTLEDAVVNCNRLTYQEGLSSSTRTMETRYTNVWMSNASNTVSVYATYSGRQSCDDIMDDSITGYLTRGDGASYLELCAYCGTANSIGMLIGGVVLLALGGGFTYFGVKIPVGDPPETEA